ncbi:MAG: hypothetical protein QOE61_1680 [Micromonosporaceae bacterium]|nr:hypothetical protein [Micromonosporaceae bacterium]
MVPFPGALPPAHPRAADEQTGPVGPPRGRDLGRRLRAGTDLNWQPTKPGFGREVLRRGLGEVAGDLHLRAGHWSLYGGCGDHDTVGDDGDPSTDQLDGCGADRLLSTAVHVSRMPQLWVWSSNRASAEANWVPSTMAGFSR